MALALLFSVVAFFIFGFYLPGYIMEIVFGSWENQPIGSGLILVIIAAPVALICFILFIVIAIKLNVQLAPIKSRAREQESLIVS